ncbi:hypothetical protein SLW70_12420 [Flavobacterium sp. NG2]|uniref:hypothetical protein n=1 Tax=Flavobacterium sp. NG2 TaxID=3097547 RepID=UPI002A840002|nr:hypothetical protein [Flavobacterium sp. NG2]WPR70731.1 hypothetical protein SLW70_12420 [Flavobacterium sp. NG2]
MRTIYALYNPAWGKTVIFLHKLGCFKEIDRNIHTAKDRDRYFIENYPNIASKINDKLISRTLNDSYPK